jgi:2-methylisocitrate lyase-like PEP mutase family enzyme
MTAPTAAEKAARLRALHAPPPILVLVNAWDVASACIVEAAGFPAVATSSAGIANSLGFVDGERISRGEMAAAVARIAAAVRVPVTADMEAGYGSRPEEAALTARAAIAAGAVGLNLEDGTRDPARPLAELALQVEKLCAVREAGEAEGVPLVINARTDTYLAMGGDEATRFAETVRRAQAFRAAGADCVFVPGLCDPGAIIALLRESPGAFNVVVRNGLPPAAELERLGVARLSFGPWPYRAALGQLRRMVEELRAAGTYAAALEGAPTAAEINRLLRARAEP